MNKRLIWVEGDDFTGWCCSQLHLGHHRRPSYTVAALAFNRLAQDRRDGWRCQACGQEIKFRGSPPGISQPLRR